MRRRWIYPGDGGCYELVDGDYVPDTAAHHIIGDIEPFRSPDGAFIEGRSQWREHLKRTDSIEMGHSDVKSAQGHWAKRREAFQSRLKGKGVAEAPAPSGDVHPIQRSRLNVELANRLHGRPAPARKELIKLSLDLAKRMSSGKR